MANWNLLKDIYLLIIYISMVKCFQPTESGSIYIVNNQCDDNTSESCDTTTLTTEVAVVENTFITDISPTPLLQNDTSTVNIQTSSSTTESVNPMMEKLPNKDEIAPVTSECSCDLTSEKCDINCCCDSDCTESDRKIFSFCIETPPLPRKHSGLCFSHQFIYKNNTRYNIVKEEQGLFCISKDNFPDRLHFTHQMVIHSLERFNKVWERKKHFIWPQMDKPNIPILLNTQKYKYGTELWKYDNVTNEISTIALPISLTSNLCSTTKNIRFLENVHNMCLQQSPKDQYDCQTNVWFNPQHYCSNLKIIGKLDLLNHTHIEDNSGIFIDVRTLVCEKEQNCLEISLPTPFYNESSKICHNVMKNLEIVIYHNGSQGILDAECLVSVHDVILESHQFSQSYKVIFEWMKNETNIFHRSGIPGYLLGKPVISGILTSVKTEKATKETVAVSKDLKDWISLPKGNNKGDCSERMNLYFGENVQSQCTLKLQKEMLKNDDMCSSTYNKVWSILLGDVKLNQSDTQQLEFMIASYGDPVPHNRDDWVPIYLENTNSEFSNAKSPCKRLLNGVKYQILYSYFGPISNPQIKIIGVSAKLLTNDIFCFNSDCSLKIISTVSYIDVSQNAINKFAKTPVVKIKLPQDFFYPFSSYCTKIHPNPAIIYLLIVAIIKNVFIYN